MLNPSSTTMAPDTTLTQVIKVNNPNKVRLCMGLIIVDQETVLLDMEAIL